MNDYDRGLELASDALQNALDDDWDQARTVLETLSDELGGEGIWLAIIAWCDTLILTYRDVTGTPDDAPFLLGWREVESGRIDLDADAVPVPVRWAGRVIAARAVMDEDGYEALIGALPDDQLVVGEHVTALLSTVSRTLTRLVRSMS